MTPTADRAHLAALLEMRQLATAVEWYANVAYLWALRGDDEECDAAWAKGMERLRLLWTMAQEQEGG